MANGNNKKNNEQTTQNTDGTVKVLYQKMGNRWFAFSLINDEVFVGSIPQEEIDMAVINENNNKNNDLGIA